MSGENPSGENPISYDPATDMLWVELREWPGAGTASDTAAVGGEDAETDLVVHYAADGEPWAWEIEHASTRPDLVARALREVRARRLPARAA